LAPETNCESFADYSSPLAKRSRNPTAKCKCRQTKRDFLKLF